MTNEPDAFLKAILVNPADPLPRLVFADWLEETGVRPNIAWAKYLRLAEEVATSVDDVIRTKKSRLLERVGSLIQAKLRFKAELFVAHTECLRRVLPLRCMVLDVDTVSVTRDLADVLPGSLASEYGVLPLHLDSTTITVAADAMTAETAENLGFLVNRRIEWLHAPQESLGRAVERAYDAVGTEVVDCVTFSIPFAPHRLTADAAYTPAHRIIELLLGDARDEDVRDIVIRRSGPRIEVRFYRAGSAEYDIWGGFPPAVHLPIVNHFRRLARLPIEDAEPEQSGIFRYHFGRQFYDVALRIQPGIAGLQIHLTILPYLAEPTVAVNRVA